MGESVNDGKRNFLKTAAVLGAASSAAGVAMSPGVALAFTGAFVIISQIKINVTNAYAGSIAWSNFFSRLTHSHPGRVVWLVFNVAIALMLMELGIFKMLEHILGLYSIVAVSSAWASDAPITD